MVFLMKIQWKLLCSLAEEFTRHFPNHRYFCVFLISFPSLCAVLFKTKLGSLEAFFVPIQMNNSR